MIIADSGPLIALANLELIEILHQLFKEILLPQQVYSECTVNMHLPGAMIIQKAVHACVLKLKKISEFHSAFADPYLGDGERAAMSLALINNTPVLLDDRRARMTAERQHLQVIGTAGILLAAKQKRLIQDIKPFIKKLEDFGYYISAELKISLLKRANEH